MTNETIQTIVARLLKNIKETAEERKIENIVYHYSWYKNGGIKNA